MNQIMGHGKKKNHQQQNQRNGKQKNLQNKTSVSPYFHNNFVDTNQQQTRKQRHKSTDDALDTFGGGSFYNDHLKNQNTSTPIANNSGFMTSSSSAFRATNTDSKLTNFSNKKKPNGKNNTKINQSVPQVTHQDQFKRRLFTEGGENLQPKVKPFSCEMPERWKNFRFDRQKLNSLIY